MADSYNTLRGRLPVAGRRRGAQGPRRGEAAPGPGGRVVRCLCRLAAGGRLGVQLFRPVRRGAVRGGQEPGRVERRPEGRDRRLPPGPYGGRGYAAPREEARGAGEAADRG